MIADPFCKSLVVRKCSRRAFSVDGSPVVAMGQVDIEFKLGGASFTHTFTILRGLIHPMLLGLDFLGKYNANISFDGTPGMTLRHPVNGKVSVEFLKPARKPESPPYVSLVSDIEIQPLHIYYADAYISNVARISGMEGDGADRLLGITSIQNEDPHFDPGVLLRDGVIDASASQFKVELMNPSREVLKVEANTPLGVIFDSNCKIIDTDGAEREIWKEPPEDAAEARLRQQALFTASISVEENSGTGHSAESPVIEKDPLRWPQPRPPPARDRLEDEDGHGPVPVNGLNQPLGACGQPPAAAPQYGPTDRAKQGVWHPTRPPSAHRAEQAPHGEQPSPPQDFCATQPANHAQAHKGSHECWHPTRPPSYEPGEQKGHFSPAFADKPEHKAKFSRDMKPEEITAENKPYIVFLEECSAIGDPERQSLREAIEECPGPFAADGMDVGCTKLVYHHVKIDDGPPVYLSYHKAQGTEIRKVIDDQTQKMLAAGIIRESESPFCSPIVMVRKPKCGGWRYCVDLRKINERTQKITFPVPKIEDAIRRLKKPKIFSSLDLLKAYYQIPVVEEHQKFYAYSDGRRHLQFARCPMGAKNSGSSLALLMELVLRGLPPESVIGYLDDILVATEDWESHLAILKRLFRSLDHAGLKLCPGKCKFARKEIKALGYRLSAEGIRPDDFNLDKVRKWDELKDKGQVRTFLGLTGYYRSLIKGYAHIAAPLSDLLHDDKEWVWGDKEKAAFDKLKDLLVSEPVAAYPDYDQPFILKTDASKVALGAVLGQKKEAKKESMIACTSKKFNSDELKWIPYDREYWAVIYSVRHFTHYLRFKPFELIVDHKPLLAWRDITTQRDGTNKRTRWAMELSTYEFNMVYKEGRKHADADALSRHPAPDEADEHAHEEEVLSLVETDEPLEISFLAAVYATEIPLVEIHSDKAASEAMRVLQDKDDEIRKVKDLVAKRETDIGAWRHLPNWYIQNRLGFVISDGVLYHTKIVSSYGEPIARTVIPTCKRLEMLYKAHGHLQSGHPSAQRALGRLEKFATWHGMTRDIDNHVQRCAECQAVRTQIPRKVSPVQAQIATAPLQFVQADLYYVGQSHSQNDYVMVMEDRFTKHCRLFAIRDTKAKSVAACLESYVSQMGSPDRWGTDGGKEFFNKFILAMCMVFNIHKEFSLAYKPSTNGQTERKNRSIKTELRKRCHQFGPDWPSMLKWIEFSYNTTVHPSQGFSPFVLMFGREPRLPIEQDIPHISTKGWNTSMKTYFSDFLDRISYMRSEAIKRKREYMAKMVDRHDKNVLPPLQPGTRVLRAIPQKLVGKLDLPKDGPWVVTEQRMKEGRPLPVYIIKDTQGNTLFSHREDLTPFLEPLIPNHPEPKRGEEAKRPEKEPKPVKERRAKKPAKETEGPASRTRSKCIPIISCINRRKVTTPAAQPQQPPQQAPPSPNSSAGGGGGGSGGDDDNSDGDGDDGNEGDNNNNGSEGENDDSENNDDDNRGSAHHQGHESRVLGQHSDEEEEQAPDDPSMGEDENETADEFNVAQNTISIAESANTSKAISLEDFHTDPNEEDEEAEGYLTPSGESEGQPPSQTAATAPHDDGARALFRLVPTLPDGLLVSEADIRGAAFRMRSISVHTPPTAGPASEDGELLNPPLGPPVPAAILDDDDEVDVGRPTAEDNPLLRIEMEEEESGSEAGASANLRRSERSAKPRKL